jgi:hypothetical protein
MALVALVALVVAFPLFTFTGAEAETTTTQAAPTPSTPLPKGTTSNGRASISLRSLQPLTIAGRGFKSGERVRVSGAGARTVIASRRGGFVLRMGYRDPCASLSITAIGSKGSRASLNFSQLYCAAP